MSDVVYLYGFVPPDAPPAAALRGVAGAPVRLLDLGAVRAVVSTLAGSDFADAVEERLADVRWVAERGLEHEQVVAWFVDHSDIVPARLFSLHSSEAALRAAVGGEVAAVAARLRACAGRREWDLKVAADVEVLAAHGAAVAPAIAALDEEIAAAPPGRRYLLQRKRADSVRREVRGAARRIAHELLEQLRPLAEEARVLPLADAEGGAVLLSAALLVRREREPEVQRRVAERAESLEPVGVRVAFSGPWAPYRFVQDDVPA